MEITNKTPINSLLEKHPEAAEILMAYGLHCVNCHFSDLDNLEDGAMMHGMSDEEFGLMVKDVNKIISKKDKIVNVKNTISNSIALKDSLKLK